MGFKDIPGQNRIKENLKNALKTGRISHAYIFDGSRGSHKKDMARMFAAGLLCEKGEEEPCGVCHSCRMAFSENHPDIITLVNSGKSGYVVDDIRTQINGDIIVKPFSGEKKIYIIPGAEKMNQQAQNALLKTLEEPPGYAVIILLCENHEALLPTIRSRCTRIEFEMSSDPGDRQYAISLVKNISGRSLETIIAMVSEKKAGDGEGPNIKEKKDEIFNVMLLWYRDVLMYKSTGDRSSIRISEEQDAICAEASRLSFESIYRIMRDIENARARINANVKAENVMESLLLEIKNG